MSGDTLLKDLDSPDRPAVGAVRAALRSSAPHLAQTPISFLAEGWDNWIFAAGDAVVRCPKNAEHAKKLGPEWNLLVALTDGIGAPIPKPIAYCDQGPNGLPAAIYRKVDGVPLIELGRPPSPGFGAALGRLLAELHSLPVERGVACGLDIVDGTAERENRTREFRIFVDRAYPLLTPSLRTYATSLLEAHLLDEAEYRFDPQATHGDVDDRNVLADPKTGELTGVIDFGDARISNPSHDFAWAYCGGFAHLGIEDQVGELLHMGGMIEARLRNLRDYLPVFFALNDIVHGLDTGEERFIKGALLSLEQEVSSAGRT